ncbi:hypothetical protein EXD89_19230 [Acinetobacter pittii]|nr:hypothetical protein EXD89_19230 [Acinetobacter pittii]
MFTAWSAVVASATLLMLVFAASIPAVVMLGPPVMVKPLLSNLLLPVVTLSRTISDAKLSCTPSAVVTLLTLLSPLTLIVSPNA